MGIEDKVLMATYHCQGCGKPFEVEQGCRRRFCDACLLERVKVGRTPSAEKEGDRG